MSSETERRGGEIENLKEQLLAYRENPHFKFLILDDLTPADWELFRKFLEGTLSDKDLDQAEKQLEEEFDTRGEISGEEFLKSSRENFLAFLRNLELPIDRKKKHYE